MTNSSKRILFLDLMRAFAVLMMVQGHTVHTLLADEYRNIEFVSYGIWHSMRGFTAPIFMFTAGVVFTYLLKLKSGTLEENTRIRKGFRRFILLVLVGYILRYPTHRVFEIFNLSQQQLLTFFSVDALHLIGFGILSIILLSRVSEKFSLNSYLMYILGTFAFFVIAPIIKNINFVEFLPLPIAAYFNYQTGSLFPLFPWIGYLLAGAVLGNYLAENPGVHLEKKLIKNLFLIGVNLFLFSIFVFQLEFMFYYHSDFWTSYPALPYYRLGFVVMLCSGIALAAKKINKIPKIIVLIGRYTLIIYVVHLIILYGSAFIPGLSFIYSKAFGVWETIASAIGMIILMSGMVMIIETVKQKANMKINTPLLRKFFKLPEYT